MGGPSPVCWCHDFLSGVSTFHNTDYISRLVFHHPWSQKHTAMGAQCSKLMRFFWLYENTIALKLNIETFLEVSDWLHSKLYPQIGLEKEHYNIS